MTEIALERPLISHPAQDAVAETRQMDTELTQRIGELLLENLIKPHLQSAGLQVPKVANPTAFLVMNYNIQGAYSTDIPICLNEIFKGIWERLDDVSPNLQTFRIAKEYIQPLPRAKIASIPQEFLKQAAARLLVGFMEEKNIELANSLEGGMECLVQSTFDYARTSGVFAALAGSLHSQINEVPGENREDYHQLIDSLAQHLESFWDRSDLDKIREQIIDVLNQKVSAADRSQQIARLKELLPENSPHTSRDLWSRRLPLIRQVLNRAMAKGNMELPDERYPAIVAFQEANVDQVNSLKQAFPDMEFAGYSNNSGKDVGDIPYDPQNAKYEDGHGFTTTFMYDPKRWDLLDVKKSWLSNTPDVPSKTEGGSYIPRTVAVARFHDKLTGDKHQHFATHIDHMAQAHPLSVVRVNRFVNEMCEQGKISSTLSGDMNTFSGLTTNVGTVSYHELVNDPTGTSKKDYRVSGELGHYAHPNILQATFLGKEFDRFRNEFHADGKLKGSVLDHIFNINTSSLFSFMDSGAYDPQSAMLIPQGQPDAVLASLRERNTPSDHFLIGQCLVFPSSVKPPKIGYLTLLGLRSKEEVGRDQSRAKVEELES